MTTIRAAFYARVSSEQQAAAHTIESQLSALSERARSDGTPVPPERQFVDDGISGAPSRQDRHGDDRRPLVTQRGLRRDNSP